MMVTIVVLVAMAMGSLVALWFEAQRAKPMLYEEPEAEPVDALVIRQLRRR